MEIPYKSLDKVMNLKLYTYTGERDAKIKYKALKDRMASILQTIKDVKDAMRKVNFFAESFRESLFTEFRHKLVIAKDDFKYVKKQLKVYKLAFAVHTNMLDARRMMGEAAKLGIKQIDDTNFYTFNGDSYIWKTPYKDIYGHQIYMIIGKKTARKAREKYHVDYVAALKILVGEQFVW